jgi:hypothetical protein
MIFAQVTVSSSLFALLIKCLSRDPVEQGIWHMWEEKNVYRVLVGKPEEKDPLGRSSYRWKITLKRMDEHGLEHLAVDRDKWWAFVNAVVNLWLP